MADVYTFNLFEIFTCLDHQDFKIYLKGEKKEVLSRARI